jgi:type I restriction enzyme S subunit
MTEYWQSCPISKLAASAPHSFTDGDWVEAPHIRESGIRLIQTGNIGIGRFIDRSQKYISQRSFDALHCKEVNPGDLLICRLAEPIGRACFAPDLGERMITSVDVTILRADTELFDSRFISFCINTPECLRQCETVSGGTTRQRISRTNLGKIEIKAPNIRVQRRIAEILSTVDEAIEQTEALIAKYQQVKAGLMYDLFTRGITPDGHLRPTRAQAPHLYKESPLGWIPKEWDCLTVEELLAKTFSPMRSGPFGSALLKDELVEDGIPFLGIDNVFAERFVPVFRRFVPHQKFVELIRYAVFPGDVIITIMGTVGRCCVVPDYVTEALSSKHLWTMTFDDSRVFPELVCWQLNHARWVKDWFARYSQGAVMEAIQSSTLRSLQLPVPKIDEQKLIVSRYRGCTHLIEMEETHAAKLQQQKHGLMHDLLTGRVRVKGG